MSVCVRFAPSPTGKLHVGNARTAMINWLFAKAHSGKFILRLDDTDKDRSEERYEKAIKEDLKWLGLDWDQYEKQSQAMAIYQEVFHLLKEKKRLYPCYETAEELSLQRKTLLAQGRPPIYNRAALHLSEQQKKQYEQEGRSAHWRFKLSDEIVEWQDLIRGQVRYEGAHTSDPVLFRSDGLPLYTLPSVVDDHRLGVTHIVRGEDHVTNTAVQIQIIKALGYQVPTYGHLPLIADQKGEGLSKRLGSLSLEYLRENYYHPMAINSLISKIGTADAIQPYDHLDDLIASFDIAKFSRSTAKLDEKELDRLTTYFIHKMSFKQAKPYLDKLMHRPATENFWQAIHLNLNRFEDVLEWEKICYEDCILTEEQTDYLVKAYNLLPEKALDFYSWEEWTKIIQENLGLKGKALYIPLRYALTGKKQGPEMKYLLPLLGKELIKRRLTGK